MVEFALVFPLLLALAVSVADYGYYLEHVNNITTVVRDSTRYASQNSNLLNPLQLPWTAACAAPAWSSSAGTYSCPATSYTTHTTASYTPTGGPYSTLSVQGFTLDLPNGANVFIGGPTGPELTLTAAAPSGSTSLSIESGSSPWTPTSTYTSPQSVLWYPPSTNVEALVQDEAEALTVPEGGLALDNVDCTWTGGTPPAAGDPAWGATPGVPGAFPVGSGASGTPTSCISIVFYKSSDGSYSASSLNAASDVVAWWSSDANSDAGCLETSSGCSASPATAIAVGDLVQITVMYNWSSTSPGPVFTVLNATFGLRAYITAQFALVVQS
jgi:hypothetical protein